MKRATLNLLTLLLFGPGSLSGQLREMRQTIFGMD